MKIIHGTQQVQNNLEFQDMLNYQIVLLACQSVRNYFVTIETWTIERREHLSITWRHI